MTGNSIVPPASSVPASRWSGRLLLGCGRRLVALGLGLSTLGLGLSTFGLGSLVLSLGGCGRDADGSTITTSGSIDATEVHIATKVGGKLLAFLQSEGDQVKAGQTLAQIDTVDIALLLQGARADRDQAAADLRLRVTGSRVEDIAAAEAQVARAEADLEGAEKDLLRMQGLLDRGSGTQKAKDDAQSRRDQAAAGLRAAREQLRKLKTGSRPEEIDAAKARLAGAEARMAQLTQQLHDATITSPLDGLMTEKMVEAGEFLSPGTSLCVITDLAHPWLTVYVGEPDLARIRLQQQAAVKTDAGQRRAGRITFIAQEAEFTPKNVQTREERIKLVYKVKISLENADGLFKAGMPAEAVLHASGSGS
jgi:HlyD family secretion protein